MYYKPSSKKNKTNFFSRLTKPNEHRDSKKPKSIYPIVISLDSETNH